MDLTTALFRFFLAALAVAAIGVVLARSADALGQALRLRRSITGFVMLAAATSLPELVVACQVTRTGAVDMAAGSMLGSCLMNLLILAAIDLSRRSRGRILSRQAAAHALASLASILLATLVVFAILLPTVPQLGRLHVGSALLLIGYVLTVRLVYVDRKVSEQTEVTASTTVRAPEPSRLNLRPFLVFAIAAIGLLIVSQPLASTSNRLAEILSLGGTFFGAVFLAFVTSLPEAVTTFEASRMDNDDMAIGNIFGSNAFNLLILVAIDFCYDKPLFSALSTVNAIAALGVVVTTCVATMGLLYRLEKRIWYLEPDAVGVILIALVFLYLLYVL